MPIFIALTKQYLRHHAFPFIAPFAPTLASHHAKELVALTLAEVKGELPAEAAAWRTQNHSVRQFSDHDLRELSINYSTNIFFPPSPLREPFASLFKVAPGTHSLWSGI